ncbi:uroporphyrinogen-III C-methyltransferase [Hydrogenophaga sp.]|uniref:uroporphyrinogen-III C-methyltransferase n=1 Tax=Hydrogenophaga sp. TaxID=1904254 RepID=UPI0019B9CC87|nr:uroporphyrinogen-III C-methyltransferase [Hydrogenophaga sp.]MBD3893758.1 hypothetical protein [Hydrogenophaga sp.]
MNTPDSPPPGTAAPPLAWPVADAATAAPAAPVPGGGRWPLRLALLLAALALLLSGLTWQRLAFTQQELARRSQDSAALAAQASTLAAQTQAQTQALATQLAAAELRLSEVSLQRTQLEELVLTLSRSRDDALVQELESSLRLAQQQTELTGSARPLIAALQAADQRIARAAQPRLNPVQRAIARDIEIIHSATLADIATLVLRLDQLGRQVDHWPLLNAVGPQRAAPAPTPPAPAAVAADAVAADAVAVEAAPAAPGVLAQTLDRLAPAWRSTWERVWADFTLAARDLVRVRRIEQPEALLLAPEQAVFLRENLRFTLLNARLGLLGRHLLSSQSDVLTVHAALTRYFDPLSPQVQEAKSILSAVHKDLLAHQVPRPDATLAALAAAAGGR